VLTPFREKPDGIRRPEGIVRPPAQVERDEGDEGAAVLAFHVPGERPAVHATYPFSRHDCLSTVPTRVHLDRHMSEVREAPQALLVGGGRAGRTRDDGDDRGEVPWADAPDMEVGDPVVAC
jgi:hypothetical protein